MDSANVSLVRLLASTRRRHETSVSTPKRQSPFRPAAGSLLDLAIGNLSWFLRLLQNSNEGDTKHLIQRGPAIAQNTMKNFPRDKHVRSLWSCCCRGVPVVDDDTAGDDDDGVDDVMMTMVLMI